MRPQIHFGPATLIAAAIVVLTASSPAQQTSTPPSSSAPASGAPASTSPSSAPSPNAPASQSGSPQTAPAATSTGGSGKTSDRPAFGVPNDTPSSTPDTSSTGGSSTGKTSTTDQGSTTSGSTTSGSTKPGSKPGDAQADARASTDTTTAKSDALPSPGEALDPHIKKGSEDDVDAIGTRNIGGRGLGNWYSVNSEIGMGKQYSMEIEKSAHLVNDPVINEYINRVGQNIVKNSDCKVPFTIKVIDSDEINAMALPGGFFYVNSGLIMAADEEAELAGVMAHETAHVCAHHAAREMTKMNYFQIGEIPLIIFTQGTWTGYGIYEAYQLPGILPRFRGRGGLAGLAVYV
jgi:hypothetical protein